MVLVQYNRNYKSHRLCNYSSVSFCHSVLLDRSSGLPCNCSCCSTVPFGSTCSSVTPDTLSLLVPTFRNITHFVCSVVVGSSVVLCFRFMKSVKRDTDIPVFRLQPCVSIVSCHETSEMRHGAMPFSQLILPSRSRPCHFGKTRQRRICASPICRTLYRYSAICSFSFLDN